MAAIKSFLGEVATGARPGWAELSSAPLAIARKAGDGVKVVSFEDAAALLKGKVIRRPTADELAAAIANREIPNDPRFIEAAYVRELPGVGKHIKVIIGAPRLP